MARKGAVAAATAAVLLAGCSASPGAEGDAEELSVYATTGYLADAVANIAPDAEVTTMVGPGGDPHTYQPSTQDIETIQRSDLVLWNGLDLEAQMIDQLESLGDAQLAVAEQLPADLLLPLPETDHQGEPLHDPHVWNSPEAWSLIVGHVADKLGEIDPDGAEEYQANAEAYQAEITSAADEAEQLLASIPEPRILITGHDAFNYFGQTYDLEVYATDFISTEAALSAGEISELAQLIADNQVPVIFQDNQANPQAIQSLSEAVQARDWDVEISDAELYADSLGAEPGVDTYLGVFRHNAQTVAAALGEEQA
jgi:manganese/zinc/iron transport system substrate-binding protein